MRWLVAPFFLLALLVAFDNASGPAPPTIPTVAVTETEAAPTDTARPPVTRTPTAVKETQTLRTPELTATPRVTNRRDCAAIRGSDYLSGEERTWFLDNCTAPPVTQPVVQPSAFVPIDKVCDASYPDVCIQLGTADYDCAGGSENGPNYIAGPIRVRPPDPHGLDRDGDGFGFGCE